MARHLSAMLPDPNTMNLDSEVVDDIMASSSIRQLKMPDGSSFAVRLPNELRLCLGLFIDWYNGRANSLRGGIHSTGGIYIVILNLPPALRFQKKYMYYLFIPGPIEPSTHQLNNLLRPLINDLHTLYTYGLPLVRDGYVLCRAMLAVIIADQLAARRIAGFSAVNHHWFCPLCRLPLEACKTNLDILQWPSGISQEDHRQIMKAWRDAPSKAAQDAIFQRWGFRYSELSHLTYFNMMEQIVIEPFHAILANVAQPHCRETIGEIRGLPDDEKPLIAQQLETDDEVGTEDDSNSDSDSAMSAMSEDDFDTDQMMQKGIAILRRQSLNFVALDQLFKLKVNVLARLCQRCKIFQWSLKHHGNRPTKHGMVIALGEWVCRHIIKTVLTLYQIATKRSAADISKPDLDAAKSILSSVASVEEKKGSLKNLSVDVLFEICIQDGVDTNILPLEPNSIYPKRDAMINRILDPNLVRSCLLNFTFS
jgi:hypothetical protein